MKNILHLFIFLLLASPAMLYGQVFDGFAQDSTIIRFNGGTASSYHPDTAISPLWQMGRTHKTFFAPDSTGTVAIMTDTLNHYPVNANNWFSIEVPNYFNVIVDFWHKYQMDTGRDGGVVEFSLDSGATWQNIKGDCNADGTFSVGIRTQNCYSNSDTLESGVRAFTGTKDTLQFSRIQFFSGYPQKMTSGVGCEVWGSKVLRFRFISDSTADSLAGWLIDSIKIEMDRYEGLVGTVKQEALHITPNPSLNGLFTFPAITDEEQYTISIYNAIGQRILAQPYKQSLDLSHYANGLYFYSATNGNVTYTGRLLKE
jgi:hypothetical protein